MTQRGIVKRYHKFCNVRVVKCWENGTWNVGEFSHENDVKCWQKSGSILYFFKVDFENILYKKKSI